MTWGPQRRQENEVTQKVLWPPRVERIVVLIVLVSQESEENREIPLLAPDLLREKKVAVRTWWGSRRRSREPKHGNVPCKDQRGLTQRSAAVLWCFQLKDLMKEHACLALQPKVCGSWE